MISTSSFRKCIFGEASIFNYTIEQLFEHLERIGPFLEAILTFKCCIQWTVVLFATCTVFTIVHNTIYMIPSGCDAR